MTWAARSAVLFVIIFGGISLPGNAQSLAEIRGTVTDETGGLIVGASVTLTDQRGGQTPTSTNQEGVYRFPAVSPGKMTLTISAAGFAPASRTVEVPTTGLVTVDVELRVAIRERVEVREGLNRISLDSRQNLSAIRLSDKVLEALPDDPESLMQALRMLAASTGTRMDLVTFYVDGMPLDRRLPSKDVIQSIRINSNPFSAEFPEPGASRVEILTKPASQHFHGHGRFDFNDATMNARNLFEPTRARYQFRTYEGYIGGPVVSNRWGFLLYGGLWEQDDNVVVNANRSGHTPARGFAAQHRRADSYIFVFVEDRCAAHAEPHACSRIRAQRSDSPQRRVEQRFRLARTRFHGRLGRPGGEPMGNIHFLGRPE
jgi:Carboxypeptidase regulatory-like domain